MAPNLLIASQKVFTPHKWFKSNKIDNSARVIEEWSRPVPGRYEHIPGRGWFLIAKLKEPTLDASQQKPENESNAPAKRSTSKEYVPVDRPVPLKFSFAADSYFLEPDFYQRKKTVMIKNEKGKEVQAGFFRVDDVAWVKCWDADDNFIPGSAEGYQRWVWDSQTKQFRKMLKRDDPNYIRSRRNSPERDVDTRSQETISRTGSVKNGGPSVASTRPNSIRYMSSGPTSTPGSQRPSRQSSPKRNDSLRLEEAKAALRRLAREHEAALAAGSRSYSRDRVEQTERGRISARVGN